MRIFVLIPPQYLETRTMEEIRSDLMANLSSDMVGFNQHIKVDDCYASEVYFAFGKVSSLYTVELPTAFRKISQCYGANNAFIPLLDDYIGSSLSNAHSSSKSCSNPGHCYLVGSIWLYYYILSTPEYTKCTDNEYVALLMIPSLLGGFPIIMLHNMYVRAESDLLSPFLSLMMFCRHKYTDLYHVLRRFLYIRKQKRINYMILLKDPYALQVDRPQLPLTYFKRRIRQSISGITKNEEIRKLFDAKCSKYTDVIIKTMESANVIDRKVFSNIYAASPEDVVEDL